MPCWADSLPKGRLDPRALSHPVPNLFLPARFSEVWVDDDADQIEFVTSHQRIPVVRPEAPIGRCWDVNAVVQELIARSVPGRVLDLGCGSGREAVWLAANGWSVTGIDRLDPILDQARAREELWNSGAPIRWIGADFRGLLRNSGAAAGSEETSCPLGKFDFILALYSFRIGAERILKELAGAKGSWLVSCDSLTNRSVFGVQKTAGDERQVRSALCEFGPDRFGRWERDRHTTYFHFSKT